jgi:3-hydroxyacyl-CoA dehydrogenase
MDADKLKIGVVGSGTMGKEISKALTENKYPVLLKARKDEDIRTFLTTAQKSLKKLLRQKKISQDEHDYLAANTAGTTVFDDRFSDVDIVIENIIENSEEKKKLFKQLEAVCPEKTIICTNTSSLSVTALAEGLQKKDRFLGLHFFQPFRAFKFVEVVKGKETAAGSLDIASNFIRSLKKFPLQVVDSPGFFFNRVQLTIAVEAFLAIGSGWHDIEELNEIFKSSKFYTAIYHSFDKLGLDILEDCFINFNQSWPERFPLPDLITTMAAKNRYGEKSGKGFFSYHVTPAVIDEEMQAIVAHYRNQKSSKEYLFTPEMAIVRAMNEGIYCLENGIADMQEMEDAISSLPPFLFTEGFYRAMDKMGLDVLYEKLIDYEKSFGARFHPADLLKNMVAAGTLGVKTGKGFFEY